MLLAVSRPSPPKAPILERRNTITRRDRFKEPLTNAPQPDASPWEAESRRAALTPDGRWGFVSHGGDGLISVIDTARGEVTSMLEVPSSLSGGGYLIALQPDMRMVDTVGR